MSDFFICSGEIKICDQGEDLKTILGSCIAICLFDQRLKIGAMNHYLLPSRAFAAQGGGLSQYNFGDEATVALLKALKAKGSRPEDLVATVVGGAQIETNSTMSVGIHNQEMAHAILNQFHIRVKSLALGGMVSRKLLFNTGNGDVYIQEGALKKEKSVEESTPLPSGLICIGASTGGTEVIRKIVSQITLPSAPVLIVQHMPEHMTKMFADGLNAHCSLRLTEARNGEKVLDGCAYLAPGGKQMSLREKDGEIFIKLTDDPPMNLFRPSVDFLFYSASTLRTCSQSLGILLTGMGDDGAYGLRAMHNKTARTLAQNEETCVVFGMPKVAIDIGAVDRVLSPDDIIKQIHYFNNEYKKKSRSA